MSQALSVNAIAGKTLALALHVLAIGSALVVTPLVGLAFAAGGPLDLLGWSIPWPEIGFAWTMVAVLPALYLGIFAVLAVIDSWTGPVRGLRWIMFGIEAFAVGAVLLPQLFLDALAAGEKNQIYVLFGFSYPAAAYLAYSALVSLPNTPTWLHRWWARFLAGALPTALTAVLAAFLAWAQWWK